jgi:hypothetical protein
MLTFPFCGASAELWNLGISRRISDKGRRNRVKNQTLEDGALSARFSVLTADVK